MIVQPDFLDHWKTQLLIDTLQDDAAPIYVIRLWSHCQNRKTNKFVRSNEHIIKSICKAIKHQSNVFENAMLQAGFIKIENGYIIANNWEVVNASLIANWENGKLGGRPKSKPRRNPWDNPDETHGVTQTKPMGNPDETDKRRVDRIGLETECAVNRVSEEFQDKNGAEAVQDKECKSEGEDEGSMLSAAQREQAKNPPRQRVDSSSEINAIVSEYLNGCTSDRRKSVEEWLSYKRQIKKPYKAPSGMSAFFRMIDSKYPDDEHLSRVVQNSMANGWIGLYDNVSSQNKGKSGSGPMEVA